MGHGLLLSVMVGAIVGAALGWLLVAGPGLLIGALTGGCLAWVFYLAARRSSR